MSQSALAENWYRVAAMRPRLRPQAQIHRQLHRGQAWYVLQDHQSGRFFRVSPAANLMLCLMNGRRTMQQIWERAGERFGAERPTEDETLKLLVQLHQSDLLDGGLPPDMAELERRADRERRRGLIGRIRSPMAMRFPLFDPDRFLDRTLPFVRPIFTRAGFAAWVALVALGLVLAAQHWSELTANAVDRMLAAGNLALLALSYPVIKALHEFGHAYATKIRGGEVHEMGIMLLVFLPVPYVDASSSSAFRGRWHRARVGAAGIMVELALASLAMVLWTELGTGLVRAALFNIMLIGGVSTVLFNGNPLLRFDGYYVLSDLVEIPNLDTRSKRYLVYLIQRYLLGLDEVESPVQGPGERAWFVAYGIASFAYRTTMTLAIALFVATKFFVAGVALALLSVVQMLGLPAWRALRFLLTSPQLRLRRRRALLGSGGIALALLVLLFLLPVPYATVAEGVVWVPDDDILRAGADGFIAQLLVPPDSIVSAGQPVMRLDDPIAAAQVDVSRAQLAVLQNRFTAVNLIDLVQMRLAREQLDHAQANLVRAQQRVSGLLILASRSGRFVVPEASKLIGKFVHQGDLLAYVVGPGDVGVHVVIPQSEIDPVRQHVRAVEVRLTEHVDRTLVAHIVRELPAALDHAPTPALAPLGGGPMLLDPSDPKQQRPLDKFYEIDLQIDSNAVNRIGGRAYARFEHGFEPLAWRGLRDLRQLFLRVVHV
jgi:putative peptide zinc metalloprotease protein